MTSPELGREPLLGELYCLRAESPFPPEEAHVKEMEIGCSPELRDTLEQMVSEKYFNAEGLRQALAGIVVGFSLEHIPRLDHDLITLGRDVYSAQSWRYARINIEKGDLSRIHPPKCIMGTEFEGQFLELANQAMAAYNQMVEMGIPKEDARYVFPWSFDSNMVVTIQGPKLVDFAIDNLNSPYQAMRDMAEEVLQTLGQELPMTIENLKRVAKQEGISFEDRMRIEEMRAAYLYGYEGEVIVHPLSFNPVGRAAVAAKTCWQEKPPSEFVTDFSREEQLRVLENIIESGHTSVTEHPHFLVMGAMSEANGQEIRRHRIPIRRAMTIWEAAKRYQVVIPPSIEANPRAKELFLQTLGLSKAFIGKGRELGFPEPELDHGVLVMISVPTFLVTNATDILHIGKRRLCDRAQWESRDWMFQIAEVSIKNYPELFEELGPSCYKGKCQESKSCGHPEIYQQWRAGVEETLSLDSQKDKG
ncbi:MAG TPA: FAD-dependent thymidylate synthase [Patescibacteria group bacterium]|nr:FAD-dependent thymidylate synthase [Patescibacteria group bacterium]